MTTIATKQKIEGVVRAEDKSGLFSFPTAAAAFRYRKKAFGTYAVRRLAVHEIRKGRAAGSLQKKNFCGVVLYIIIQIYIRLKCRFGIKTAIRECISQARISLRYRASRISPKWCFLPFLRKGRSPRRRPYRFRRRQLFWR